MATQFDPIAKDSSINTTENTPRNIADVLAEELSAIEQAIAGGGGGGVSSFNGRSGVVLPAAGDYDATQVYYNSNTTVKAAIDGKANVNTTLAGYGITDAYTKTETDTLLSGKQGTLTAGANVQINGNTISATDTTYSEATTQAAGLMSAADKTALNGAVSDIGDLETAMGNTDISGIGDGSATGAISALNDDLAKLTIKTETQSVTASAVGSFTITKPTGAKAYWVVETDKYASSYFVRYREHVYGIFGYAAPHDPYQGALTVTVQYI